MASEDDKPVRDFTSEASTMNRSRQNSTLSSFREGYKGKGTWSLSGDKKAIEKHVPGEAPAEAADGEAKKES